MISSVSFASVGASHFTVNFGSRARWAPILTRSIKMPILFSVVARGSYVLAKYASCVGNFQEVIDQILPRIPPDDSKLTYSHGNFLIHYVAEDGIVYLCITDDDFERSRAFLFLGEIKKRFQVTYGPRALTALPFAMNSEFSRVLANEMKHFSDSKDVDTISKVQGELDELKDIMVQNIDSLAQRGERLELLVNKAEDLSSSSVAFRTTSRNLRQAMWWKNMKITIFITLLVIFVLYLIISMSCGGLAWQSCVGGGPVPPPPPTPAPTPNASLAAFTPAQPTIAPTGVVGR